MADETHIEPLRGVGCEVRGADRVIADLATRQHGLVAWRQLLGAGVGRRAIGGRLERGALHLVHRGVYAVGYPKLTREGRWMAAVLACGPDAVLSHRSAGQLWGVIPQYPLVPEVIRPERFTPRPGVRAHHVSLPPDERGRVLGIPITSLSRTLLDLAVVLSRSQLERALNEAKVQRLTDPLSLTALLARYPRRRGAANLRILLANDDPGGITKSRLEERFVAFLDVQDLPRPRLNADLAVHGRFFAADCLWWEQKLVVELDGRAFHDTGRAFEKDRERDRILLSEGWRTTRVTWRQLDDEPEAIAADLRSLLRIGVGRPTLS